MCENLAAGLGAAPKAAGQKKTTDGIGNAPLRVCIGERCLELHKRTGNTKAARKQEAANEALGKLIASSILLVDSPELGSESFRPGKAIPWKPPDHHQIRSKSLLEDLCDVGKPEIIDLRDFTVLPGFVDVHVHSMKLFFFPEIHHPETDDSKVFLHSYGETSWDDQLTKESLAERTI
ncbi:hypothetical protein MPER_08342, partial [Moniliophthora perniciosa FA553]